MVGTGTGTGTGTGSAERRHAGSAWGSLGGYGVAAHAPAAHGDQPPTLPLSLTVGRWLLEGAGWAGPVRAVEVPSAMPPLRCAELGRRLAADSAPVTTGLLLLADGSSTRTPKAPGGFDPRAAGHDGAVAASLAAGDPAALARLDAGQSAAVGASGRAAWQVLAAVAAGRDVRPRLVYDDAPYGVGYLVAQWPCSRPAVTGLLNRLCVTVCANATPPVVAVVGPTATGKSDLAVALALALGGEVVNADALQLYRGMDIGTAKLPPEQRAGRPAPPARRAGRGTDGASVAAVPARSPARRRRHPGRGPAPGARRRVRAVRPGGAGPARVPRHRPGAARPARGRGRRGGPRRPARAAGRRRPRVRGPHPGVQRAVASCGRWRCWSSPAARSRPRCPTRAGRRRAARSRSACDVPRPELDERIAARVQADVERRAGRRGPRAGGRRAARGPHRLPGAGLRPGAAAARRASWTTPPPARRPRGRPGVSPGARRAGSAATPGWNGWSRTTRGGTVTVPACWSGRWP